MLLRQGPSKRSKPLAQAVPAGKGKAAYTMEQGESKVPVPQAGRGAVRVVCTGPGAEAGGGGRSTAALSPTSGAQPEHGAPVGTVVSPSSVWPPALSISQLGRDRAGPWG